LTAAVAASDRKIIQTIPVDTAPIGNKTGENHE